MATKIAPASGIVAGNVGACDAAAAGSKTPRRSTCSTIAWPAMVRTTPPSTTSTVSAEPDHAGCSMVPGQSSHQNAIIAMTGSANVESGPRTSSDRSAPPGGHPEEERHRYHEHEAGEPEGGFAAPAGRVRVAVPRSADARTEPRRPGQLVVRSDRGGIHHQLRHHGELADSPTGGVEHCVGDRRRGPDHPDLSDALGAERADELVVDLDELDRHVGCVGVTGTRYSARLPAAHRPDERSMWLPSSRA